MKSILYIKQSNQLITEENIRRDFFRFMQDDYKKQLQKFVNESDLGGLLNESVVNAINEEANFVAYSNFEKLYEFASLVSKKWRKKELRILTIGQPGFESELINALTEWSKYTGINFVMANSISDSDIRISFQENDGHWSYIGNQAESSCLLDQPTVNFDPIDLSNKDSDAITGIILHEIGHSLGLIHEHQKKNSPIIWNHEKVYQDCQDWCGWDKQKVDDNIFNSFNSNAQFYSKEFDEKSIMIYAIPNGWSSNYLIHNTNNVLSDLDKRFATAFYS